MKMKSQDSTVVEKTHNTVTKGDKERRDYTISTLVRGLEILEVLARNGPDLTAKQISSYSGIGLSTTFRFLQTLLALNYVRFNEREKTYALGLRPLELGTAVLKDLDLRKAVLPFLKELNHITGKTIALCVFDVDAAIYIEVLPSTTPIQIHSRVGRRVDLHCSGVGKALLLGFTDEQLEDFLKKPLPSYTERTRVDPTLLREEIKKIREQGVAFDDGEKMPDIRCVAAPIYDHRAEVVASFSVAGTVHQMDPSALAEYGCLVKEYSRKISRELGAPNNRDIESR